MIVDEAVAESGERVVYTLRADAPGFALHGGEARVGIFSALVLREVIERYARPLDAEMHPEGETLALSPSLSLMAWYYKSPVDLESKLYLVLHREGQESLAVLSRQVVSALRFLGRSPSTSGSPR